MMWEILNRLTGLDGSQNWKPGLKFFPAREAVPRHHRPANDVASAERRGHFGVQLHIRYIRSEYLLRQQQRVCS